MENSAKAVKTFTVNEANRILPQVSRILEDIFSLNERSKSLKMDIDDLVSIWGNDVLEKDHTDNAYYTEKIAEREKTIEKVKAKIGGINKLGCVVKDIDHGLIDFFCEKDETLVFLCWRYGEDKIGHWHALDGGFRSRSKIWKR